MNTDLTPAEEKVGLMAALGFIRKEISDKLGKSEGTICKQLDSAYKKTDSQNHTDLTRFFIDRYTGMNSTVLLSRALRDCFLIGFLVFLAWVVNTPEAIELMKTSLQDLPNSLSNLFNINK